MSLWFADRRLQVRLWLRSWPDSARRSELSVMRAGELIHHTTEAGPVGATPGGGGPQPPTPAAAQLEALVTRGFLSGRGDWYQAMCRQHLVIGLLDELYASAHHIACPPGIAGQPDMAWPSALTGLSERTLA